MVSALLFIASLMILPHVSQCQDDRYLVTYVSEGEGSCGGPAEEGTEHMISCSTLDGESDFGVTFIYRSSSNDAWHYLASCDYNDEACSLTPYNSAYFEGYFYSGEADYSNGYDYYNQVYDTANLTIYNVSRSEPFDMQAEWRCYWGVGYDTYLCNPLEIYAKAQNPQCEYPTYDSSTDTVHITCTTDHIYPQAKCQLYLDNFDSGNFQPVNSQTRYEHSALNGDPVYYSSQCSFTLNGQDLEDTFYRYYVTIYPNVTGGEQYGEDTELKDFALPDLRRAAAYAAPTLPPGPYGDCTSCEPVEEWSVYTLSCNVSPQDISVGFIWETGHADTEQDAAYCWDSCDTPYPDWFNVTLEGQTSYFTFNQVYRYQLWTHPFDLETRWQIFLSDDMVTVCDKLEIYSKAQNPQCEYPTYDSSTDTVHITCTTDHIYPQAKCHLYLDNFDAGDFQPVTAPTTYQHTPLAGDPLYYRSQCSFTLNGQDLEDTFYRYNVTIYPDVTNGTRFGVGTELKDFALPDLRRAANTATTPSPDFPEVGPTTATTTTSTQAPETTTTTTTTTTTSTTNTQTPSPTTTTITTPNTTTTQTQSPTTTTQTPSPTTTTTPTTTQPPSPTTTTTTTPTTTTTQTPSPTTTTTTTTTQTPSPTTTTTTTPTQTPSPTTTTTTTPVPEITTTQTPSYRGARGRMQKKEKTKKKPKF